MQRSTLPLLALGLSVFGCKPQEASVLNSALDIEVDASVEVFELETIDEFWPQPGACDEFFSKEYYCDGFTQLNLPMGAGSPNLTEQIKTTTAPESGFVGMQVLGKFDESRPTVLYVHGWNVEKPSNVFGFPDQWAQQAQLAGYNIVHFHWSSLAFDSTKKCPGLDGFIVGNIPCNASYEFFKKSGASDYFIDAYVKLFSSYKMPVRLVSQSLGVGLAIFSAFRLYEDPSFAGLNKPSRLDLIDPYVTVGFTADRTSSYGGQIPPDDVLPPDYRENLVKEFMPGSRCSAKRRSLMPENYLSQYCQLEGMLYKLGSKHDLGIITFSSIVGGLTAYDFRKLGVFQAFSSKAFNKDLTSKHTSPNAAYMYSFGMSGSERYFSAASSDEKIRRLTKEVLNSRKPIHYRQTAGFDTIGLFDDEYVKVK